MPGCCVAFYPVGRQIILATATTRHIVASRPPGKPTPRIFPADLHVTRDCQNRKATPKFTTGYHFATVTSLASCARSPARLFCTCVHAGEPGGAATTH